MKSSNNMLLDEQLCQSVVAGAVYKDRLGNNSIAANSLFGYKDIIDLYKNILMENPTLSDFQIEAVYDIFIEFDRIRKLIDPDRLKSFEYSMNEDNELLLFRKSTDGLTNFIIHDEECVAFSHIPYNPAKQSVLSFVDCKQDYEKLALLFFNY
ncbi:hypothetical protein BH09BAC5_BH09BAC5_00750 [soil metagenome]